MAYEDKNPFVKLKNGVKAPAGFHYMPNGKLMSDADHVAMHGYIEKKIKNISIPAKDINYLGETKSFTVTGDTGAIFSLEIYDDAAGSPTLNPSYYNFKTKTWSTEKSGLYNIELTGNYTFSVTFPKVEFTDATCDYNNDPTITHDDDNGKIVAGMTVTGTGIPAGATVSSVTSDTEFELSASTTGGSVTNGTLTFAGIKKYTIDLLAKTAQNIRTSHVALSEVRNADQSINLNKSIGSDSDLLKKIIYQDIKKTLTLSCIAPSLYSTSADIVKGSTSSSNRIILDSVINQNIVRVGDKATTTGVASSVHALVTKTNPDNDNTREIEISISDSATNDAAITFTPPFNGMTPHGTDSTSGVATFNLSSSASIQVPFSITCTALTGRTFSVIRTPNVNDLCAFTTVDISTAGLAIPGESAGSFHRWPIDNIANLFEGMVLDPARSGTGANTTTPATISRYLSTTTKTEINERKYYNDVKTVTIKDVEVSGVDSFGNDVTAVDRNGDITAQVGNITFNKQQADAFKDDTNVRLFAYGPNGIKKLTGMNVSLSNVVITPTQISTTTTSAVSASTSIPLTEVGNISSAQTLRGIGINPSVAAPTVTSKPAVSGGATITASAAQTLEEGATLFFDGASNIVTITGTINIDNMALSDTTLYFDVERFLTAV
tara:strand:- start:8564 stop:10555 length:1992 start_codon:yes stop_codon:yes gene_type:complete